MSIRYTYKLTQNERQTLEEYTLGVRPSRQVLLARALLLLDSGKHNHRHWKTTDVAEMIGVTTRTLEHLKKRMVQGTAVQDNLWYEELKRIKNIIDF